VARVPLFVEDDSPFISARQYGWAAVEYLAEYPEAREKKPPFTSGMKAGDHSALWNMSILDGWV